tara:strand:+ start:53 stop:325 length:273 start_codon:yes stop_codon:yes gene_type:complete
MADNHYNIAKDLIINIRLIEKNIYLVKYSQHSFEKKKNRWIEDLSKAMEVLKDCSDEDLIAENNTIVSDILSDIFYLVRKSQISLFQERI